MTAPQFNRYPMVMTHPGQRAAVISQWNETLKRHVPEHGEPAKFQPVTVHNEDQEEYHLAQGYRPMAGDSKSFTQQVNDNIVNPKPAGYAYSEYPKWINGVLVQDPSKPVTTFQEYPKWVGDVMVSSAEEESALRACSGLEPIQTATAPETQDVTIDGVTYSLPPAVAAKLMQPETPAEPKQRKTRAKASEISTTARRSYRDRTGATASTADAAA